MTDEVAKYKTELIDELDFLLMLARKNNKSLVPGLEEALKLIEESK